MLAQSCPVIDGRSTTGHKPRVQVRTLLLGSALVATLVTTGDAFAQAPPQIPGLPGADEVEEQEGRPKPYAPDIRTGHVYIDAFGGALFPAGNIAPGSGLGEVASYGFVVGGTIGVGVSRHAELDLRGSYGMFSAPTECESCSSDMATGGLGFTAHLTQGAAFDPWFRYGAAYRTFSVEHGEDEATSVLAVGNGRYHGVDIAQLTLGADFFPAKGFGFGPFLEVDMGTFVAWPDDSLRGTRFYAFFSVGLEIELDPVQWVASAEPAPQPAPAPAPKTAPPKTDPAKEEPKKTKPALLDPSPNGDPAEPDPVTAEGDGPAQQISRF